MKDIQILINECKALTEQTEPFQKKMKAKHSRLKKRVIGHGGQKNTPPFTQKPSMERSKSAPPMGEGIGKQIAAGLTAASLAAGAAKVGASALDYTKQKEKQEQQFQAKLEKQNKANAEFEKYRNMYDFMPDKDPTMKGFTTELQSNIIDIYDIDSKFPDEAKQDKVADLFMQDLGLNMGTPSSWANAKSLQDASALYKMKNPEMSDLNILFVAMEDVIENNGLGAKNIAKEFGITKKDISYGTYTTTSATTKFKESLVKSKKLMVKFGKQKDVLHGGKGDYKPDSDFDPIELKKGVEHEFEHTGNKIMAKEIAKDHLSEDPKYYTNLKKAGIG